MFRLFAANEGKNLKASCISGGRGREERKEMQRKERKRNGDVARGRGEEGERKKERNVFRL